MHKVSGYGDSEKPWRRHHESMRFSMSKNQGTILLLSLPHEDGCCWSCIDGRLFHQTKDSLCVEGIMARVGVQRGEAGRIIAVIPYDFDRVTKMTSLNG
jgi:hypothetical protein